jgi:hypothetical protein
MLSPAQQALFNTAEFKLKRSSMKDIFQLTGLDARKKSGHVVFKAGSGTFCTMLDPTHILS